MMVPVVTITAPEDSESDEPRRSWDLTLPEARAFARDILARAEEGARWLLLATHADADAVSVKLDGVTAEPGDHVHQDDTGRILHVLGRSLDDDDAFDAYSIGPEGFALESMHIDWNQDPPAPWIFAAVACMPTERGGS